MSGIDQLETDVRDTSELLELAEMEEDSETIDEVDVEIRSIEVRLDKMEFRRMFSGEADANNAFVDIQSGSGGTEAQDWAEMLLRMYTRWAEDQGFGLELVERSVGDVAGIKSATIKVSGEYAYGHLRTETGVQ